MTTSKRKPARPPAAAEIVVTRVLAAPPKVVWQALTQARRLKRWWAPKGFTTPACTVDLRVGGSCHFCMRTGDGTDVWGLGTYREIVAPARLVYTDCFADAVGHPVSPTRYGVAADFPAETLVTFTLAARKDGKTKLTLRHAVPVPLAMRNEMAVGWRQMLDKLAALLKEG